MASANGTCPCNEEEDVPMTNGNQAKLPSKISVVLGAQWGDEGKGRFTGFTVCFHYLQMQFIVQIKSPFLCTLRSSKELFLRLA